MKFIVLGSGESGSGAVYDYLKGRNDIKETFKKEFRLIPDPGGIIDLHAAIAFGFHVNKASAALKNFRNLCKVFGRSSSLLGQGEHYSIHINNFENIVEEYIKSIQIVNYKGMPSCERVQLNPLKSFYFRRKHKKAKKNNTKPQIGEMFLPVTEDSFLKKTVQFINSIFYQDLSNDEIDTYPVIVNQGGTFWQPLSSTQYFSDRKVIVVTRDPRDIFSEFQFYGQAYPGADVNVFCDWYKGIMSHIDYGEWESDLVMHIKFEDFVKNFNSEVIKVNEFLGIDNKINSTYDPDLSEKNIGKFKNILSKQDVDVIEAELMDYLHY